MKKLLWVSGVTCVWMSAGYAAPAAEWKPSDGIGGILIAIGILVLFIKVVNWYSVKKHPDDEKIDSWLWFERVSWFWGHPIETLEKKKAKNAKDTREREVTQAR